MTQPNITVIPGGSELWRRVWYSIYSIFITWTQWLFCLLFQTLTEPSLNSCWHVVVLMSSIICELVKWRAHLWSNGLLRGELHFQALEVLHTAEASFCYEQKLKIFCSSVVTSVDCQLWSVFELIYLNTVWQPLFFSWIFIELKLITVFMKSFWCKGSEVRDYLVNISALVQTPGAAGLRTTKNNDKKSCWLMCHYNCFNILQF